MLTFIKEIHYQKDTDKKKKLQKLGFLSTYVEFWFEARAAHQLRTRIAYKINEPLEAIIRERKGVTDNHCKRVTEAENARHSNGKVHTAKHYLPRPND